MGSFRHCAKGTPDARERILAAAERLFAKRGVEKTSTREITTEAGVNVASVNYYFRSKEALTEEIFMRLAERATAIRLADLSEICRRRGSGGAVAAPGRALGVFHQAVLRARQPGALFARFILQHRLHPSEMT